MGGGVGPICGDGLGAAAYIRRSAESVPRSLRLASWRPVSNRAGWECPSHCSTLWTSGGSDGINVGRASPGANCQSVAPQHWIRVMKTKEFLVRVFTWWNGATLGTLLWTARFGELVGTDEYGTKAAASIPRSASSGAG